jgi:hypothetical protein
MSFSGLTTLEELNLQLGEYAVCMAKRNPFSSYYPMVIRKVKNGYICPALETYITDISGGFRIPDPTKGDAAGTNNNVRDGGASTAILGEGDDIWYLNTDYGEIEHGIIENVHYKNSKLDMFTVRFDNGDIDSFDGCWFGKTFFQTKEKAKNAMLQERK